MVEGWTRKKSCLWRRRDINRSCKSGIRQAQWHCQCPWCPCKRIKVFDILSLSDGSLCSKPPTPSSPLWTSCGLTVVETLMTTVLVVWVQCPRCTFSCGVGRGLGARWRAGSHGGLGQRSVPLGCGTQSFRNPSYADRCASITPHPCPRTVICCQMPLHVRTNHGCAVTPPGPVLAFLAGHDGHIRGLSSWEEGNLILSASEDATFKLWDLRIPALLVHTFSGHTE